MLVLTFLSSAKTSDAAPSVLEVRTLTRGDGERTLSLVAEGRNARGAEVPWELWDTCITTYECLDTTAEGMPSSLWKHESRTYFAFSAVHATLGSTDLGDVVTLTSYQGKTLFLEAWLLPPHAPPGGRKIVDSRFDLGWNQDGFGAEVHSTAISVWFGDRFRPRWTTLVPLTPIPSEPAATGAEESR